MSIFRKIWRLLTTEQRRTALRLLGLMLLCMVLDTLGTGLVIPTLALLTEKDPVGRYPAVAPLIAMLGYPSHERLVILGMLVLVIVSGIRVVFLAYLSWRHARFAYDTQASLSQELFDGYLRQPWSFHLQRNSAQLIRNVTTEVSMFANVLGGALILLTEGMVVLGISILLMVVEPVGALLVFTSMGLAASGFHHVTRSRLLRWGRARQLHEGHRIQHLQQGFGGAKEIKLLGREDEFLARYQPHNFGSALVAAYQQTVQQIPRLWLEFLAVLGLVVIVLLKVYLGEPLDRLLPTLGLFAAAAFRVLPSVSRVINTFQTFRYSLPVVTTLSEEVALFERACAPPERAPFSFEREIAVEHVSFRYSDATKSALQDVSLRIPRGAAIGIIGGSGSGKSTLIDIILGLLAPSTGRVSVDGVDILVNLRGWSGRIGYVPQSIFLTDDTLRRNVAFGVPESEIDDIAVNRALRTAQLEPFIAGLPDGVETLVGERGVRLSGGQRQRIGIARALYRDPPFLVLDEATSSLDVDTEREAMQAVNALHGTKTILIVAHRLSTVANCDRLIRLDAGRVVEEGETATMLGKIAWPA